MPPTETMKMGLHGEAWQCFWAELREHSSKDGMPYGGLVDYESQKIKRTVLSTTVPELVFIPELFWFMTVPPWIVDGHVRWDCRDSHEDWREELGDNSKNNLLSWAEGNNPDDFHVAIGSLFRKYSWSCSHFNSKIVRQIVWQSHRRRQTIWSQQWKQGDYWKLMFIQTSGHSRSKR